MDRVHLVVNADCSQGTSNKYIESDKPFFAIIPFLISLAQRDDFDTMAQIRVLSVGSMGMR